MPKPNHPALLFLAALVGVQGCLPVPRPKVTTFRSQEDAGRIMVGTQTVAPFEDYIDALQPRFHLTTEDALAQAIPQTQTVRMTDLRSLLIALQLAFPTKAKTETEQTTTEGDTTSQSSHTELSSTSPSVPAATVPEAVESSLQAVTALDSAGLQTDAMLRYRAATALYQEIALLSSYVRDAAVTNDTVPYIVRQLVTVLPNGRRVPYDVHLTLAYFSADPRPLPYTIYTGEPVPEDEGASACVGKPVRVIPLFVTDSVETSLIQANRGGIRDIGFSASGATTAVGAGLGIGSRREAREESVSRELNSILTLGAAADNVLGLRIGAAAVENTYHLVSRTFNITALVLLPAHKVEGRAYLPCRQVRYTQAVELRDARDGTKLNPIPRARLARTVAESTDIGGADASLLLNAAIDSDFKAFKEELVRVRRTEPEVQRLWVQYVRAASRSGWSSGAFELPAKQVGFYLSKTERLENGIWTEEVPHNGILDDGSTATLRLAGAYGLTQNTVEGRIQFVSRTHGEVELLATKVELEGGGRVATVKFPSILKLSPDAKSATVSLLHSPLFQRWSPSEPTTDFWKATLPILDVRKVPSTDPDPQFVVALSSDQVRVTSAGRGQLAVSFRRKKVGSNLTNVYFSLHGGHIVSATPALGTGLGAHKATPDTIYRLDLGGLVPGSKLRLEAWCRVEPSDGKDEPTTAVAPTATLFVVGPEPTSSSTPTSP